MCCWNCCLGIVRCPQNEWECVLNQLEVHEKCLSVALTLAQSLFLSHSPSLFLPFSCPSLSHTLSPLPLSPLPPSIYFSLTLSLSDTPATLSVSLSLSLSFSPPSLSIPLLPRISLHISPCFSIWCVPHQHFTLHFSISERCYGAVAPHDTPWRWRRQTQPCPASLRSAAAHRVQCACADACQVSSLTLLGFFMHNSL